MISNSANRSVTSEDEIHNIQVSRPHLVLLGAGASVAALPQGDKNGKFLPLMSNLIQVLGLDSELNKFGIHYDGRDFEDIYSEFYQDSRYQEIFHQIEERIGDYFYELELPDQPTLYDHLVLSLREKDYIATFNWDPLLFQAWRRNYTHTKLPHILFLHGNVAVGHCMKDMKKGWIYERCNKCGEYYTPSKLLFPINQKNYASDPYIHSEWETLKRVLAHAYIFTIFGYSAPKSDVEAISLMKQGWGQTTGRNIEQIEIIDIKTDKELFDTWQDFIYSKNYWTATSFNKSWLARHPRRSCDALWRWLEDVQPVSDNSIPTSFGFEELWKWYAPFAEAESQAK